MDPYLGLIMMWPMTRIPIGWMACDGSSLPISGNEQLYSILGTTYGGNSTNFNLPDLRARVPIGVGKGTNLSNYTLGSKGGTEGVRLTTAQMAAHTHNVVTSGVSLTTDPNSGLSVSTSPATQALPDSPNCVIAAGASDFDNGGATLEVFNFGANTNLVQLNNTVNLTTSDSPGSVGFTGSGNAHNNVQPTVGVTYIICIQGIYPVNPN